MNYELVPIRIPRNPPEIEAAERRLNELANLGGKLIGFMPSTQSDFVIAAFETQNTAALRSDKVF